jgi:gas vesicle protein
MRRHVSRTAEVASFSAGALLGAGLAFLYAPRSGHETRERVADATNNAISKMRDMAEDAQEKLNRNLRKGRDYAEEKAAEVSSAVEEAEKIYH